MHRVNIKPAHQDLRGEITDLITENLDSVTRITFTTGSVRGNHVHKQTTQWVFVVYGKIEGVTEIEGKTHIEIYQKGDFLVSYPGEPHAFRALESSEILAFTTGPRSGADFNSDTFPIKLI
jgi:quercetin dioxygenase-like cupin family protein